MALWADVTLYLLIHLASHFQVLEVGMGEMNSAGVVKNKLKGVCKQIERWVK